MDVEFAAPAFCVNTFSDLKSMCFKHVAMQNPKATPGAALKKSWGTYKVLLEDDTHYDGVTAASATASMTAYALLQMAADNDELTTGLDVVRFCGSGLFTVATKEEPNQQRKRGIERTVMQPEASHTIGTQIATRLVRHGGLAKSGFQYRWGPHPDKLTMQRDKVNSMRCAGARVMKTDVSGWDFSVGVNSMQWAGYFNAVCTNTEFDLAPYYARVAKYLTEPVMQGPKGYLYMRTIPGGMPSGTRHTTVWNSFMRVSGALANGSNPMVLGDDCVEVTHLNLMPSELMARYREMGLNVRDVEEMSFDKYEMCSHLITHHPDAGPEQPAVRWGHVNCSKSVFRLVYEGHTLSQVAQLLRPNFSSPADCDSFLSYMDAMNVKLKDYVTKDGRHVDDFDSAQFMRLFVAFAPHNVVNEC